MWGLETRAVGSVGGAGTSTPGALRERCGGPAQDQASKAHEPSLGPLTWGTEAGWPNPQSCVQPWLTRWKLVGSRGVRSRPR